MEREVIAGSVLVVLFLVSMFPMSTFLQAADSHGGLGFSAAQSTTEPVDWWPVFHHDPTHTGYSTSTAPNTNQTLWSYITAPGGTLLGNGVWSSPAVANGVVFVGSLDNETYALNATTGMLIWNYTTEGWIDSSPAVADGMVLVGSCDNKVYALNATTGALVWNFETGDCVESSPAVAGGLVYVGSDDNDTYALNETDGALVWSYTTGGIVYSSPAVADGVIFVGSWDEKVYALNSTTGAPVWNYTTPQSVYSSPVVAGGIIFVGSAGNNLYALNASTGAFIWSFATGGLVFSSPAVVGGVVFVGSYDGMVYALNASTGLLVWNYTTNAWVWSSPAVAGGLVFVGSDDHKVYALNATTGAFVWSYATGERVYSSPAVVESVVYVGSNDGNVYAFGQPLSVVNAEVCVLPLNLKSEGKWAAGYVALPEGFNASDIGSSSLLLNGTVEADPSGKVIFGDFDNGSVLEMMVEFNRTQFVNLIVSDGIAFDNVTLSLTGQLLNGTLFEGPCQVQVSSLMGDINCDGKVSSQDIILMANAYGSHVGDSKWNGNAAFAEPLNTIGLTDLVTVAIHYGQQYP